MPEVQRTDQRVVLYLVLHTYYVVPLKLLEEPLARSTVAGEGSFEIGNHGKPPARPERQVRRVLYFCFGRGRIYRMRGTGVACFFFAACPLCSLFFLSDRSSFRVMLYYMIC
jgi:hypothetical protein